MHPYKDGMMICKRRMSQGYTVVGDIGLLLQSIDSQKIGSKV
jgi:hypothetical protein